MSTQSKIHLVSYATPQFRHRQIILGLSARLNGVVDAVDSWSLGKLKKVGFEKIIPEIRLNERGSGFWSWKPFIIQRCLQEIPEGDIVLYCDVGRIYPFKLLDQPLDPFLRWMELQDQEIMPGIQIPWDGPISQWTKRDALLALDMDHEDVIRSTPIQASFSLWRSGVAARKFVAKWLELCAQRKLVSDDPSVSSLGEHTEFLENRHDQALLSLLCIKERLQGLALGKERPPIDSRNPSEVSRLAFGAHQVSGVGLILQAMIRPLEKLEQSLRPPIVPRNVPFFPHQS
jgi:hypothetical protein